MREKANVAEQDETALKRNENFSLEIHIFFSSKKMWTTWEKSGCFKKCFILLIINKIRFSFKIRPYGLGNGVYGREKDGACRPLPEESGRRGAKVGHTKKAKRLYSSWWGKSKKIPLYLYCSLDGGARGIVCHYISSHVTFFCSPIPEAESMPALFCRGTQVWPFSRVSGNVICKFFWFRAIK